MHGCLDLSAKIEWLDLTGSGGGNCLLVGLNILLLGETSGELKTKEKLSSRGAGMAKVHGVTTCSDRLRE